MKKVQDCCIGIHMVVWFAAFLPITYIWYFSPHYPSLPSPPSCPSPSSQLLTPVCDALLLVSLCSHCSTPAYEWEHSVFDFLFLCQFAENDGFQIHPSPYKGHELIIFYGCVVFHSVYVPHFSCPVYHRWAFGLVPGLTIVHRLQWTYVCMCLYSRKIYSSLGIYSVMGVLG